MLVLELDQCMPERYLKMIKKLFGLTQTVLGKLLTRRCKLSCQTLMNLMLTVCLKQLLQLTPQWQLSNILIFGVALSPQVSLTLLWLLNLMVQAKSLQSKVLFQSDIASSTSWEETDGTGVLMLKEVHSLNLETQVNQSTTEIEIHFTLFLVALYSRNKW